MIGRTGNISTGLRLTPPACDGPMNLQKLVKYRLAKHLIQAQPLAALTVFPIRSLLVICFDAIGDFVLSLPAIEALRRRYPHAVIELLCSPRNLALAQAVAGVAACHAIALNDRLLDPKGWRQLRALKDRKFDLVANLFDEPDELAMAKMLFVANGRLLSLPLWHKSDNQQTLLESFRLRSKTVSAGLNPHFVHRMLAITEGEVQVPLSVPTPCNPGYDTARFGCYVVVNLSGSQGGNSIGAELQGAILTVLPVVPDLTYICFSQTPIGVERPDLICLYPDSILDAATLIRDARAVLSTDTSIIHVAASLAVPLLILMNSEPWRDAFIPLSGQFRLLRVPGDTLAALDADEVAAALADMLVS